MKPAASVGKAIALPEAGRIASQPTDASTENLWGRILNQRLLLVLVGVVVMTVALSVASYFASRPGHPTWLDFVPWEALTGGAFSVALIAFAYDWLVRSEGDSRDTARLNRLLGDFADRIGERVWGALAIGTAGSESYLRRLEPDELDAIGVAVLATRTADDELASEWYKTAVSEVLREGRRLTGYRATLTLVSLPDSAPRSARDRYFCIWVSRRYRTTLLRDSFLFTTAADHETYDRLHRSGEWDVVVVAAKPPPIETEEPLSLFGVESVRIAELDLEPATSSDGDETVVTATHADLGQYVGQEVEVSYEYWFLVNRADRRCTNFIAFPTKDIVIAFDVSATDARISHVTPMFVTKGSPVVSYTPSRTSGEYARSAVVNVEGWSFPKGGVVFSWHLPSDTRVPRR